ncbi:hypothetical protein EMIT0P4_300054 [Pseudomonas sp. IT-P4]
MHDHFAHLTRKLFFLLQLSLGIDLRASLPRARGAHTSS